ncbi:nuclear transcription factor Y subunit A-9-like [Bidens hawaiensis]|uniref:nuclear transcription factor Y subunit A-9-like n=1 Tax=Bidens hawaiensis TaxID=980011 RepID=UPI0040499FB7
MPFTNMQPSLLGSSSPDHSLDHVLSQITLNIVPSFTPDIYGHQQLVANYQQQHHALPNMLPVSSGIVLNQVPQPEFFGHNIGCAPYPYYGGMMTNYGPPTIPPQSSDVSTKLPLAPKTGPEPVFVNAKQYDAILRRRKSREKAENGKKLIKGRKTYVHESRHLHAMNRPRGIGGRFSKSEEVVSLKTTASESSETSRQSYLESPANHFPSSDLGEDWQIISPPNQG